MIMVHKPVHLLSSPAIHHRRLSSAPSPVVVQPTRTPGLLSLSKPAPARQQPRRQPRAPKPKTSLATSVVSSEPVKDVAPLKAASPAPGKDVSSGPKLGKAVTGPLNDKDTNVKPSSRGRQRAKAVKGKADPRGASPSSARTGTRHRQAHHQGSPPQSSPIASQAEAKENADRSQSLHARSGNQFDPFLSTSSDSESDSRRSPSPAVQKANPEPKLTRPSGKLARRRAAQHTNIPASPTPAKAVPVPRAQGLPARDSSVMQMSRSAPGSGAASGLAQSRPARSDMFPICDDMTDVDEDERVPTTPTRPRATWQQQGFFDEGPRTAPLSSAFPGGPFFSARASTPSPIRRRPSHARSPSEGVFSLSFEEESSSSPSSSADEELKALVGLLPRRRMVPVTSTPPSSKRSAGIRPPNFFASSTFQNSPSPEDLPAPMF